MALGVWVRACPGVCAGLPVAPLQEWLWQSAVMSCPFPRACGHWCLPTHAPPHSSSAFISNHPELKTLERGRGQHRGSQHLALLPVTMQATAMLALTLLILVKMSDEGTQSPHLEALGGDAVQVAGAEARPSSCSAPRLR